MRYQSSSNRARSSANSNTGHNRPITKGDRTSTYGMGREKSFVNGVATFGKYRGKRINEIPDSYLQWCREQGISVPGTTRGVKQGRRRKFARLDPSLKLPKMKNGPVPPRPKIADGKDAYLRWVANYDQDWVARADARVKLGWDQPKEKAKKIEEPEEGWGERPGRTKRGRMTLEERRYRKQQREAGKA